MTPSRFTEYAEHYLPSPRAGMTTVEAGRFLAQEYPQVVHWTSWTPAYPPTIALQRLVGNASETQGKAGDWSWTRVPCSYPQLHYWTGFIDCDERFETAWVGTLEIQGSQAERFLLFSYLDSQGQVGARYLASTADLKLLRRFAKDLVALSTPPKKDHEITVRVLGGRDYKLSTTQTESLILPPPLKEEIEAQVFAFFSGADTYRALHVPHRRGFLFTGSPGNGKTLMLRHLIRECHARFRTRAIALSSHHQIDEEALESAFDYAASRTPCMLLLEDLDSLANETLLTRAGLLSRLDGLCDRDGILLLGTTNNPGRIDEALIHRPSRFDRVWHFRLPDFKLRFQYLHQHFPELEQVWLQDIAKSTDGWSFAYLNELRVTAAILTVNLKQSSVTEFVLQEALQALAAQFQAGKNRHVETAVTGGLGFHSQN